MKWSLSYLENVVLWLHFGQLNPQLNLIDYVYSAAFEV